MKFGSLKIGKFINWDASGRPVKQWNAPGKVLNIKDGIATIITFDDFKQFNVSKDSLSLEYEISPATKSDVRLYVEKVIAKLQLRIVDIELDTIDKKQVDIKISEVAHLIEAYTAEVEKFL